jgi:hypothetical protein
MPLGGVQSDIAPTVSGADADWGFCQLADYQDARTTAAQESHWPEARSVVVKNPCKTSISTMMASRATTAAVPTKAAWLARDSRLNRLRVSCRTLSVDGMLRSK